MSKGPMKSLVVRCSLLAFGNQNRHREVSMCMLVFSVTCPNDVNILLLKVACYASPPGMCSCSAYIICMYATFSICGAGS